MTEIGLTDLVVGEELGRGAFTMVHRARRGDRWYAVKRPLATPDAYPAIRADFNREAALLACIDDAAVVRVHATGDLDGMPALVLEEIPGGTLADLIAGGVLSQERVVGIAAHLARGLAAAHRLGLVHRDIKPGNIMVSGDRPPKLIDFGLAQLGRQARDDEAAGTFLYASPEQSGMLKRPVDGRSDLYSLGVVLFECLSGRLPFEADDVGELLRLHLTAPVPDLTALRAGADPALVAVIGRLLAKDPDDRYPDAAALLADLRGCPGGAAAEQPAVSGWPLVGRDAEADRLRRRWELARQGQGGVAVIRGGAGSGRTRLIAEVAGWATTDGVPVLRATGRPGEATPLAVAREAIGGWLETARRMPEAEQLIDEAYAAAGPALLGQFLGETDEGEGEHVLAAAVAFVGELATRSGGLLIAIDDADDIDSGTRQLLVKLVEELPSLPVLLLLTTAVPIPAGSFEVTCAPLGPADVASLIASRLPGARVPDELAQHVVARTDGTPLAVVSYLLRLVDVGLVSPFWGEWRLDMVGADALPPVADVRDLLAARLARQPAEVLDCLTMAAVAGVRFRPEPLIDLGEPDRVVAALAAGVDRHVLEPRPGGRYAFVHPQLRDLLIGRIDAAELRKRHAAMARALERLPEGLRDEGHAYVVARHYRGAGDAAPAADRLRSVAAAGLRALTDQAPAEAVDYLAEAVAGDPAAGFELLHPLAQAYLRAGRYGEAAATLDRALAAEPDRLRRARLLTTRIELHHTLWDDARALDATRAALGELRRPLPGAGLLALVAALCVAFGGGFVRRTHIGFGTARGRRRESLAALTAVLDAGGYAAAIGLRLREAGTLALRAVYAVNRLGPSPEYVRVYSLIGYVTAVVHLRGTSERCLRRAGRVAAELGDPALTAYVEWLRGCALLFGGYDDGTAWERVIARYSRWYSPAQTIPGYATVGLRLLLRGYVDEAEREYDRALRHLGDSDQALGTSLGMLSVMIPSGQSRFGEAGAALKRLREAFPDGTGTPVQRANMLTAACCFLLEQGEVGVQLEEVLAEFHALRLRASDLMPQHRWVYVYQAQARLIQLRYASDTDRSERLRAARAAVAELGEVGGTPLLRAVHLSTRASLFYASGDHQRCLKVADEAEQRLRGLDAPFIQYEVFRIRARAMRALGMANEAERQARYALAVAAQHGWEQRRRQTRTEFGVDEGAGTHRRTVADRRPSGRNRHLDALQQIGSAAATILDPQQLAQVALDEMLRILGAERALFFLVDSGEPVRYAGRDASGDLDEDIAYGATLVRRVAESGEPLVVTGTDEGAALGSRSAVVHGLRSILVAPVQFKGRLIAVVYLDSRLARGIFTDDDVAVLTAVSSHVAVSLETARAAQLHSAVQAAREQQAMAEMLRASLAELTAILEPDRVLRQLCVTLYSQLGADAAVLIGPAGDVLAVEGVSPDLVGSSVSVDASDISFIGDSSMMGDLPVLAVPLRGRDAPAGMILLGGAGLDDTSRQVAAALATQGMTAYENARLFSRVQELATTDELTGQHNRRHFYAIAGALVNTAVRHERQLAAAMLDIDKFKNINDTYGHGVGDEVIRTVAARVREKLRSSDVLGRYGGEEFAMVLPDHDGQAEALAERVREAVSAAPVPTQAGPVRVTISVGLARLEPGDASLDELLARADHALYRAKEAGRNRVITA
ncbi:putative serine/threonine protein kinase [Actinoplanes missouriensis 431]|uniref:Putative serine/threonine protein kinase n=1 Tax=Actinoplanes missouriensis (strain ATCC 14538 / DSM 43046 / CBS 188.64 / JCM 3121 / NBRC 102363 / NCIMB 12654 / NRRL B-3342 / UNCC 431) TaxID=512565 RepID=I0H256_ACTM4|nr:diguanylate cyclase [Actinoplanes missouriensis]BAL87093.1 putative serine/threonine protein kinase [Actinoplanes missouriensis 431]